jgi:hypothetical protein
VVEAVVRRQRRRRPRRRDQRERAGDDLEHESHEVLPRAEWKRRLYAATPRRCARNPTGAD